MSCQIATQFEFEFSILSENWKTVQVVELDVASLMNKEAHPKTSYQKWMEFLAHET